MGCGLGPHARRARLRGAGDLERRLGRGARQEGRPAHARRGAGACARDRRGEPLPVAADLENGFAESPREVAETIRLAAEAGLVGGSIEDFTGDKSRPFYEPALAVERIAAAAEAARALPFRFTLTARCEHFLRGRADLAATIERLQAYEAAGADVLFAPALPDLESVRAICAALKKPLNFMAGIPGKSFTVAALEGAGRQADQPRHLAVSRGDEGGARSGERGPHQWQLRLHRPPVSPAAGRDRMRTALFAWSGIGLAAWALLPWYFAADKGLLASLRSVFAADDSASGLARRRDPGPAWLWIALLGLALCVGGALAEGRGRGRWVGLGALVGLAGLLGGGFSIGASGWSFAWMNAAFGASPPASPASASAVRRRCWRC